MNTELVDLKKLQETDDSIGADRKILAESAKLLEEAAAKLKLHEDKLETLRRQEAEMNARHRELEAEMADLSVKKKNNENRQMSVKTDGEYKALLKEAEFLSTRIGQLEDEALELLDRLERRAIEINDQALLVTEEAGLYGDLARKTEDALELGRGRLGRLEAERLALAASLSPARLKQYEDLLKNRAGRAVSAAGAGMCQACRLSFPPQVYNELQRNEKILVCPNCARIIYWDDHPDFKEEQEAPAS